MYDWNSAGTSPHPKKIQKTKKTQNIWLQQVQMGTLLVHLLWVWDQIYLSHQMHTSLNAVA